MAIGLARAGAAVVYHVSGSVSAKGPGTMLAEVAGLQAERAVGPIGSSPACRVSAENDRSKFRGRFRTSDPCKIITVLRRSVGLAVSRVLVVESFLRIERNL